MRPVHRHRGRVGLQTEISGQGGQGAQARHGGPTLAGRSIRGSAQALGSARGRARSALRGPLGYPGGGGCDAGAAEGVGGGYEVPHVRAFGRPRGGRVPEREPEGWAAQPRHRARGLGAVQAEVAGRAGQGDLHRALRAARSGE